MKNMRIIAFMLVMMIMPGSVFSAERDFEEFHKVAERIRISNLVNAMSLSLQQQKFVLNKNIEARSIRRQAERKMEKHYRDFLDACENLEEEVTTGRLVVDKKTAKDFHKMKGKMEEIKYDMEKKLNKLSVEIVENLEEHQIYAAKEFIPCLVPKMQDGRMGQEGGDKHFIRMLDLLF